VLELKTGGEGGLRAQGGQLRARPRDVDPVVHEVSLSVESQERYEDARLRPVRQLLERDDADEAVTQPQMVAPDQQVIVQQAPDGRGIAGIWDLLNDGPRQAVALAPRPLRE